MSSHKEYAEYILDQLSAAAGVTYRPMMGEYILYIDGKIFGGIYDDRLLVKPVEAAKRLLPGAPSVSPYPGAKEMLLAEDTDDRELLCTLVREMADQLPPRKKK